ncbi:MAG: metallophosphoesterase family protein [Chloroflexi bacterium]|nr:metallophosphoesterase family protein [Chloroflexota bacterium]
MRIAAIYDIHGNLPALEAVLREIKESKADLIVVGGDVVAGPMPVETLSLLQEVTIPTHFILGNAESDVLRHLAGKDINGLSERANAEARWVAKHLSYEHKQFLSSWAPTLNLNIEKWGELLFCHGTPRSDVEIFTKLTSEKGLASILGNLTASIVICGHTHMQFDRAVGKVRIINAGSVGMPFGRTGADWLLIDTDIKFKHTVYDTANAAERIRKSDYPQAEDFIQNNVLQAPSEIKMLEMLTKMEANQTKKTA